MNTDVPLSQTAVVARSNGWLPHRSPRVEEALRLARLGYNVFPCVPRGKRPLTRRGFHDASRDPDQIEAWWREHRDANIGLVTTGLLVIDIDGADHPWITDSPALIDEMGSSPMATTPRGGRHIVFRQPEGKAWRCSASKLAPNVDVRADGGYIVVAPSITEDGKYAWQRDRLLDVGPDQLPLPPEWLAAAMDTNREQPPRKRIKAASESDTERLLAGERNSTLASIAGGMRREGMSEVEILAGLSRVNNDRCDPPLGSEEVADIARSIGRYPAPSRVPVVVLGVDEHRVIDQASARLATDPNLFRRGAKLVQTVRAPTVSGHVLRTAGSLSIAEVSQATLRERLTRFARVVRRDADGHEVPVHPPGWLVRGIDARGVWPGIQELNAVSDTPFLRTDGTICQQPGYDEGSGVLYQPGAGFSTIPENPSQEDAASACLELLEPVTDFLFERPEHQAGYLAGLLTPIARFAFDGPAPLFLIDANVRAAGKGLLAQVIGEITLGREMPVSSYSSDSEEMRKKITSIALAGDRTVLLDNLTGAFGDGAMDRALTTTRWRDRVLGTNRQVDVPLLAVWYATGNNVLVASDTARRLVHIRLEVMMERPEDRAGFRHADLLGWVRGERARLVAAALTVLRAYCVAGRPGQQVRPMGSFEGWSNLVRQSLVWADQPDPCGGRLALAQTADVTLEMLEQLVHAWARYDPRDEGVVVSVMLAELYPQREAPPQAEAAVAMRSALEALVGIAADRTPTPRQIGSKLRRYRRRVVDGRYLDNDPGEKRAGGAVWRLKESGDAR